jgi:hypothetical protein
MKVMELMSILATMNPNTEVVVRVGLNHGAKPVSKVDNWRAIGNPNRLSTINMLLPDNRNSGDTQVIVLS